MPFYTDAFIARVRGASDIVRVVEDHQVALKRVGRALQGLCPFHREKTPSFSVLPADQIFHCFGCGAKGDVFRFTMLATGLDFPGAVGELARRAGLAPEFADPKAAAAHAKGNARRKGVEAALAMAADYFEESLWKPAGSEAASAARARSYLAGRGLSDETARAWRLGWAPERWDGLIRRLADGAPDQATRGRRRQYAVAAGLARPRVSADPQPPGYPAPGGGRGGDGGRGGGRGGGGDDGALSNAYDFFRGRIMFPVLDARFRPIGFGGRLLEENPKAGGKYINSPESVLFRKRQVLYGLPQASREIQHIGQALVVEGYMDVILCHQHGIRHAVATLGTALTEDHLTLLRRALPPGGRIVALFDDDAAGERASLAATRLCMAAGMALSVARGLPHKDPGAFLPAEGAEAFRKFLAGAEDAYRHLLRSLLGGVPAADFSARSAAVTQVMEVVNLSPDPVARSWMRQALAAEAGVPESSLPDPKLPPAESRLQPAFRADGARTSPPRTGASGFPARGARPFAGHAPSRHAHGADRRPGGGPGGGPGSDPDDGPDGGDLTVSAALRARREGLRRRYGRLLAHMWANRDWCGRIAREMPPDQIADPHYHQVARLVRDAWLEGGQPLARDLLAKAAEPEAAEIVAELALAETDLPPSEAELGDLLGRFAAERRAEDLKALQAELRQAQERGDENEAIRLLTRLREAKGNPHGSPHDQP